jgi:hypothetical protein
MSKLYFLPLRPAFDSAGITVPGSKHWFTLAGGNVPSAPFADAALTVPLENPVIANGIGYLPPVYLNETPSFYRVRVYLPHAEVGVDTPLEEYDPYDPTVALLTYLGSTGFEGLLKDATSLIVPTGTDMVSTTGADATDHGGANYVAGTAPTARSGFTSANTRNFVLSKEQVIVPQQFYQATDPDFQNAMQGALDYQAATAANTVLTWYRGASKVVVPQNSTPYLLHAPLEPTFNGIIEGENAGPWTDGTPTQLQWTNGTTGFRGQDINTTSGTGTTVGPGTFAGSGVMLRGMTLIGGLDSDATEGEFHAIHARTRMFVENCGMVKWQGDGFHAEADVGSGGANASFSQVSNCRMHHIRHGMYLHGGDSNVINVKSVDVVYARRWGFWDAAFLGNRFEGCHTSAAGIQNPGYLPSVVSNGGNLYAVVAGQEVAASTNAPSGTATDNAYWYYIGAGGVSIPLNNPAWASGMTVAAGGGYYVSGGGALTTLDDCYGEGGQGPVQMPNLGLAINGTHATGVKGAYLSSRAGRPITLNEFAVEDPANSAIRTQIGSGGNVSGEIFAHFHPAIGGAAGAMSIARPLFSTDIYYLTMSRGSYNDDLVPIAFSTNNSTVGNAPWGPNRPNCPTGLGIGGVPMAVAPSRSALAGLFKAGWALLTESGREGVFKWSAANQSALVTADTLQGIYVAPASDTTGASGAWVRQWDGPTSKSEWWGAVVNNGAVDSLAAIKAALNVHGNVELQAGDYYISAVLVHDKPHTRLAGRGCLFDGATGGTRLIVSGGTATCVQVGPTAQPATINDFPQGIVLENVHCARGIAPVKGSTATSVRVQFTLNARLNRVRGAESIYGIHVTGNVNLNMLDCYAVRAVAGSGGSADQYRGFYIDGSASIGAAGGNASVWVRRANSACNTTIADSSNIYVDASYTDCFILNPETTSGSYGIYVNGRGATTTANANRDLIIEHPVCDQHTVAPIRISNVNRSGSVEIISPYSGPNSGCTAALYIDTCLGAVAVRGGQLDMSAAAAVPGVLIVNSNGVVIDGTTIHDCTTNAVAASASNNLILKPITENFAATSTGVAVQLSSGCVRATIAPVVLGLASKMPIGVQLVGSANSKIDVIATGIDPVPAPTILTINAITITARGDYTSAGVANAAGTINVAGQIA